MTKDELVTYNTAVFYVEGGFYSISQLEGLIEVLKAQKAFQDKALARSVSK